MPDDLIMLPTAPPGVDEEQHLRNVLHDFCMEVDEHLDRLHRTVNSDADDEIADLSTALRMARQHARSALDGDVAELEAQQLLLLLTTLTERAGHVFAAADMRVAFGPDVDGYRRAEPHALAIGDLCGAAFMQHVFNEVSNVERFLRVERQATHPFMHAFMRVVAAGIEAAEHQLLTIEHIEDEFDALIAKVMDTLGPIPRDADARHLRVAGQTSTVLWNLVRRARRNGPTEGRDASLELRQRDLEPIHADVRFQIQRLPEMPDFAFLYDVGLGYGMVEPVLEQLAEAGDVRGGRRPDLYLWYWMLGK